MGAILAMNGCERPGRQRQAVGLHRGGRLQAVLVDRIEELLDALGAKTLVPVLPEGRLVVVGDVGVVGVEGEAGVGIVDLRQLFEGDGSDPIKRPRGAVDRREAVAGLAQRHEPRAEEPDVAGHIGEDDVLRGRDDQAERREKIVPVPGGVDADHPVERRVVIGKAGEGQRDRLAGPGDAGQIVADVGQHGAVAGRADRQLDVGPALDADRLLARLKRLRAVGRQVFPRVGRVDRLDEQVLRVGVGSGDAPGDMVVLAEQHDRRAGHGRALQPAVGRDDPGEVPQNRRPKAEMRVVGEDRLAGDGARAGDDPFVRRPAVQARQRADLIVDVVGGRRGSRRASAAW